MYIKIRALRKLKGYNQSHVAKKLGISQKAYSKIELGQTKLNWQYINQLAEILDTSVWVFVNQDIAIDGDETNHSNNINLLEQLISRYENEINKLKEEIVKLNSRLSE
ncbi:MAG: helix-turn-helix transcriptional regulator [Flavobacteriales bacterium]|nr:helix-turn-helix transcriptional regulator [Flavobacteriales bacterium]